MCAKLDEYNPFTLSYITIIKIIIIMFLWAYLEFATCLQLPWIKRKKSWLNTDHDDVSRVNSFQPSNDQLWYQGCHWKML